MIPRYAYRWLVVASLLTHVSGCALLSRPVPLVTLELQPPPASIAWPSAVTPGRVTAIAALQGNRILVARTGQLLQHEGVRWVEAPAVLINEYLHRIYATRPSTSTNSDAGLAILDVWLTDFRLVVDAAGERTVRVSASAELRCRNTSIVRPIAPQEVARLASGEAPDELAADFSSATQELVGSLLEQVRDTDDSRNCP